ncbi:hypothetical protein Xcel_1077 [Xylanimonas cellulosilytica DSM 15894]|uniref:DUF3352 domain-containing protein n=1 Tax=Xylanimonas cellulosilytica (strain DSM 15894 / JCM 12276 / CECT 5975 / KCTC 9989 / LMG 20990 / NBRC 107835 / XIL07) TaxID=446471 RepID=D1BZF4_XYLCX|nr:hypothetical protein Xcel_1077 [Xylanimonas cellulosilytica DSM 15894]
MTAASSGRSRRAIVVGSVVGGLALLGGAGAWAVTALGGGGAQPEDALPASTTAYLRVDLDPSAGQKINLLRLANKVPDLADTLGVELGEGADLRQLVAEALTASGECEVDYAADVEPWIGDRAAVAMLPGDPEPTGAFVVAVTDEDAARTAIESGLGCGEGVAAEQIAFTAGYVVVTDEGVPAADVVADAEQASLADAEQFSADLDALGDPGLVSFWADAQALGELTQASGTYGLVGTEAGAELAEYTSVFGSLRFTANSVELVGYAGATDKVLEPLRAEGRAPTADLPSTTLAAATFAVAPDAIDTQWSQLTDTFAAAQGLGSVNVDALVDLFATQYDIHLPGDLATLFGEQFLLAVDAAGLDDVTAVTGVQDVNVGLRTVGDADALQDLADRLNVLIAQTGTDPLATAGVDDGLVFATNDDYAQSLASGGDLGSSDAYRDVVDDDGASSVLYVDLDGLVTVLQGAVGAAEPLEYLEPLRALGLTSTATDDHAVFSLRVSFD